MRVGNRRGSSQRNAAGMTLIEIMVVVAIMGMIAAVVTKIVMDRLQQAKVELAKVQIAEYVGALEFFYFDNDFYPSTSQGLKALVEKPSEGEIPKKYPPNGYLEGTSFLDPWKNEYRYLSPGAVKEFDIISLGRDRKDGGENFDADIKSWELNEPSPDN